MSAKPSFNYDYRFASDPYILPNLGFDYGDLEPVISAEIMELHHSKHHKSYVDGLNKAIEQLQECRENGDFAHIKGIERSLAFNYSGHVLHSIFWKCLDPSNSVFDDSFRARIESDFGTMESFKSQFIEAGASAEGSAWVVCSEDPIQNRLLISVIENHQNMVLTGTQLPLVCDVWEHAYYLKYKNDRKAYLEAVFDLF
jgi:Fe-Mn family superoxide dismutase